MNIITGIFSYGYVCFKNFFKRFYISGPQDAAGGLLKRQADYAVLRGSSIIQDAEQLFAFACENLQSPKSGDKARIFRYIDEIDRDGEIRYAPVPEIRSVHQVRVHADEPGIVHMKFLSCFTCDECAVGNYDYCENGVFIGNDRSQIMYPETVCQVEEEEEEEELKALVGEDHIIAIFTDDPMNDFYLMKVTHTLYSSGRPTSDQWGAYIPEHTDMFQGQYYNRVSSRSYEYKLIESPPCVVPAASLMLICSEIEAEKSILLSEDFYMYIQDHAISCKC